MKLAFCIFRVFPYGGLSRDFMKIANACADRGHHVRAYAHRWDTTAPEGSHKGTPPATEETSAFPYALAVGGTSPAEGSIDMVAVPTKGATHASRNRQFAKWVQEDLERRPVDLVVGFNKMPGLDVYFAGDSCFEEKLQTQRHWVCQLLPRYRHFADFERAVFGDERQVNILTIAPAQQTAYQRHYGTVETRFFPLPPDLDVEQLKGTADFDARHWLRREFELSEDDLVVLLVGSGFVTKGLDRLIAAAAALPDALRRRTHLFVLGEDKQHRFERLASRLAVADRVHFLGGRDDVPRFLHGADALALPAYDEAGGMAILEAIAAGLPVLATDTCGHASHILQASAGIVSESPFDQSRFNGELAEILTSPKRPEWRENGRHYAAGGALSGGVRTACDLIERFGKGETKPVVALCLHRLTAAEPASRNCTQIAEACQAAGYHPRIYAMEPSAGGAEGMPEGAEVIMAPVASRTEYGRVERFERWVQHHLQRNPAHCVVGFNKMPGLDLYIVTEPPAQREIEGLRANLGTSEPIRLRDVFPVASTARARQMLASESAVFYGRTKVLVTSSDQREDYADYYPVESRIDKDSRNSDPDSVVGFIRQVVDARVSAGRPELSSPWEPPRGIGWTRASGTYLRDDLGTAWDGQDPFEVVQALRGETYRIVKNRRTLRFVEGGAAYFAKVHDAVGWREIVKELCNLKLPAMGARNEYAACRYLEERGVKAPRVAAFGQRGLNPARARSFVVCDALDGYASLEDITDQWSREPPAPTLRRRLVHAVADLARSLHVAGVNHRDFYLCHIWAHEAALAQGEVELAIIDLHRAQIRPRVPRRWVLRDLAALMFSVAHLGLPRNDYLRFLARYTRRPLRNVLSEDAALLHRVCRRADRLLTESRTRQIVEPHEKPAVAAQEPT
ncbi:MAG: lipopolysaccharide core heptose(I) kinase RfaP [Gammaproteobacteria bacterium]|nr:lipopolysaccharide core heptose(I) kinase RfaP [Gammaproteobacteria bacterium]